MDLRGALKRFNAKFERSQIIFLAPYTAYGKVDKARDHFHFSDPKPGEKPHAPVYRGYVSFEELEEIVKDGVLDRRMRFLVWIDERLILG